MDRTIAFRRAGEAADFDQLAGLADAIWREHYTPIIGPAQVDYMLHHFQSAEAIESQVAEGMDYFLIESGNIPVGYLAIEKRGSELFLSKIYLLKEYRGRGLGRDAMSFIVQKARGSGCTRIALTVNKNNSRSIDAYLKMGFRKELPIVMDIGGGFVMDDFRMVRELS
jgi:GNAT superfamily N-acetyltransferase